MLKPVNRASGASTKPPGMVFENLVWTAEDVARELHISLRYVYKLISEDRIPHCKVGRLVRFSPVRVIEWLQNGGTR